MKHRPTACSALLLAFLIAVPFRAEAAIPEAPPAPGLALSGLALTPEGEPIAGARVSLRPMESNYRRALRAVNLSREGTEVPLAAEARSGVDGGFVLHAPAVGVYEVRVEAPGRLPMALAPLPVTGPAALPETELPPLGRALTVRVENNAGEARAGVHLGARSGGAREAVSPWRPASRSAVTDNRGLARLFRTAGETLDVLLFDPASLYEEEKAGGTADRLAFTVPTPKQGAVQLEVGPGQPVGGAVLLAGRQAWPVAAVPIPTVDAGGPRQLRLPRPMAPLPLRVVGTDGGLETAVLSPTVGESFPLPLPRSLPVKGRVLREADGKPVAGALVWLLADPGRFVVTGPDGGYRLAAPLGATGSAAGFLGIEAPGYVAARPEITAPVVLLARRVPGFGRVVDAEDRPVAGARVWLRPGERSASKDGVRAVTGPGGTFEVAFLPARTFDLLARAPGFAPTLVRGLTPVAETSHVEVPGTSTTKPAQALQQRGGTSPRPALEAGALDLGTLVLIPEAVIHGRAVDASGRPVPGVEVRLSDRLDQPAEDLLARTSAAPPDAVADGAGRFRIGELEPGSRRHLLFRADGYLPIALPAVAAPSDEPLVVRMERGARVSGRVVDEDEEPVAGAELELGPASVAGRLELPRLGREHRYRARSEGDGSFLFPAVASGPFELTAVAEGFQAPEPRTVRVPAAGGETAPEIVFVLQRGAELTGAVRRADGSPLPGVVVYLDGASGTSGEDGTYRASGAAPGRHVATARHPTLGSVEAEVEVPPEGAELDFVFPPARSVTGRVMGPDGQAIPGARIGLTAPGLFSQQAVSDGGGEFRFSEVSDGAYELWGEKEGRAWTRRPESVVVAGEDVDEIELVLPAEVVLTGRVLGLPYEELASVTVRAGGSGAPGRAAMVDYEGRYRIDGLGPGDWLVTATTPGGAREARARLAVKEGDEELTRDLEFGAGLSLTGEVLLGGEPLPGAEVILTAAASAVERRTHADHEGRFRLEDLPEGSYRVTGRAPRELLVTHRELRLTRDGHLTLALEAAKIHGHVFAEGEPAAGAQVRLFQELNSPAGTIGQGSLYAVHTGADGYFALPRLAAGRYRLEIDAAGFAPHEERVDLAPSTVEPPLRRFDLEGAAGLTVLAAFPDGRVPPSLVLQRLDSDGRALQTLSRSLDASGAARFPGVPAGAHRFRLLAPGAAVAELDAQITGEADAAPLRVLLTPAGRLRVRVAALAESDQLGTVRLVGSDGRAFVGSAPDGSPRSTWPLTAGRAVVERVPAGVWRVEARSADGQTWATAVVVPQGGEEVTVGME